MFDNQYCRRDGIRERYYAGNLFSFLVPIKDYLQIERKCQGETTSKMWSETNIIRPPNNIASPYPHILRYLKTVGILSITGYIISIIRTITDIYMITQPRFTLLLAPQSRSYTLSQINKISLYTQYESMIRWYNLPRGWWLSDLLDQLSQLTSELLQ